MPRSKPHVVKNNGESADQFANRMNAQYGESADDWLTAFSKESNNALAKRAAEQTEPPPHEEVPAQSVHSAAVLKLFQKVESFLGRTPPSMATAATHSARAFLLSYVCAAKTGLPAEPTSDGECCGSVTIVSP